MVDALTGTIIYFVASMGGGFLSSWMSFNASGEKFDGRKHGNALITGALSGLGWALGAIVVDIFGQLTDAAFVILILGAFFGTFGIDRFRADGNKMVARNAVDNEIKPAE